MKRDIYRNLIQWKKSKRRKPLLLRGARQTGKTYILQEFGRKEYPKVHYFNFEADPSLGHFFERNLDPQRIVSDLSVYSRQEIKPEQELMVFDEIQTSNAALNSLKYFQERANEFHLAAAGSLLGVKLSSPGSFPVGKVNFLDLHPLNFLEFLDAMQESRYRHELENIKSLNPLPVPFHEDLTDLLKRYYFVGGMPEAVKLYVETKNPTQVREVQQEIIDSYVLDFAKHAPASDIPKLSLLWNSIPSHLARENKKFIFSAVRKGARAREYENALVWLENAGLVHRVSAVEKSEFPLKHYADQNCFKIYAVDVGLLGAMARTPVTIVAQGERLFNEYEGAFVENYVAQQLAGSGSADLYYWSRKGGKAEVDFLCETDGAIYPLEVKAGINTRSKSLHAYSQQFHPRFLLRTSLRNFKQSGSICDIPLYAVGVISKLIGSAA